MVSSNMIKFSQHYIPFSIYRLAPFTKWSTLIKFLTDLDQNYKTMTNSYKIMTKPTLFRLPRLAHYLLPCTSSLVLRSLSSSKPPSNNHFPIVSFHVIIQPLSQAPTASCRAPYDLIFFSHKVMPCWYNPPSLFFRSYLEG